MPEPKPVRKPAPVPQKAGVNDNEPQIDREAEELLALLAGAGDSGRFRSPRGFATPKPASAAFGMIDVALVAGIATTSLLLIALAYFYV